VEPTQGLHKGQSRLQALLCRGVKDHPYEQGFDLRLVPEKLAEPFHRPGPRTVFINSMSDLFQPEVSDAYIEDVVRHRNTGNNVIDG
jgi:protein gp37